MLEGIIYLVSIACFYMFLDIFYVVIVSVCRYGIRPVFNAEWIRIVCKGERTFQFLQRYFLAGREYTEEKKRKIGLLIKWYFLKIKPQLVGKKAGSVIAVEMCLIE